MGGLTMKAGGKFVVFLVVAGTIGALTLNSVAEDEVKKLRGSLDSAERRVVFHGCVGAGVDSARVLSTAARTAGIPLDDTAVRAIAEQFRIDLPSFRASMALPRSDQLGSDRTFANCPFVFLSPTGGELPDGDVNALVLAQRELVALGVLYLDHTLRVRFAEQWPRADVHPSYPLKVPVLRCGPDREMVRAVRLVRGPDAVAEMRKHKLGMKSAYDADAAGGASDGPLVVAFDLDRHSPMLVRQREAIANRYLEVADGLFVHGRSQGIDVVLVQRGGRLYPVGR